MLTIRPATRDDVPAVLAFWQTAAEDTHRPPDSSPAVLALVDRDPDALALAFEGDELVGSLIAGWDGWRFHLYRLAVAPQRRRQGIATALIEHAEARFTSLGATVGPIRADAMILDDNETAHAAWTAHGYHAQQEWSRWVKPLRTP